MVNMPSISKSMAYSMNVPSNSIQTILFPKNQWSIAKAKSWLQKHKFRSNYMRLTTNEIRAMQVNSVIGAEYYSKRLPNGVVLVFQRF